MILVKNSIFFKGCFASQKAKKMVFSTKVLFECRLARLGRSLRERSSR